MSVDEQEVRAANWAFYRAFESLDLDRMAEAWSREEPISCLHPGWPLAAGWDAVLSSWRTIFDNTESIAFSVEGERIDVRGELAWVVCTEVLLSRTLGGAAEGALQATNVFRREAGTWKLAHHHASPFVPAPQAMRPAAPTAKKGMVH